MNFLQGIIAKFGLHRTRSGADHRPRAAKSESLLANTGNPYKRLDAIIARLDAELAEIDHKKGNAV